MKFTVRTVETEYSHDSGGADVMGPRFSRVYAVNVERARTKFGRWFLPNLTLDDKRLPRWHRLPYTEEVTVFSVPRRLGKALFAAMADNMGGLKTKPDANCLGFAARVLTGERIRNMYDLMGLGATKVHHGTRISEDTVVPHGSEVVIATTRPYFSDEEPDISPRAIKPEHTGIALHAKRSGLRAFADGKPDWKPVTVLVGKIGAGARAPMDCSVLDADTIARYEPESNHHHTSPYRIFTEAYVAPTSIDSLQKVKGVASHYKPNTSSSVQDIGF